MSERSGTDEVWLCDSDGSKTPQLTSFGGAGDLRPELVPGRPEHCSYGCTERNERGHLFRQRERGCSPAHDNRSSGGQVALLVA